MGDQQTTEKDQVKRRLPMRRYRVEETITVVGVAEVEATSKSEVKRMIADGEVGFIYNDGQDVRQGDGIRIYFEEFVTSPPGLTS